MDPTETPNPTERADEPQVKFDEIVNIIPEDVPPPTPIPPPPPPPTPPPPEKKKKLTKQELKVLRQTRQTEEKKKSMRDFLQREIKYTELSYQRAGKDWENMCAKIKLADIRNEMVDIWQQVGKALDFKNNKLKRLLDELEIAEEQYRRNFSKHIEIIEMLIALFRKILSAIRESHEKVITEHISDFTTESVELEGVREDRQVFYESVLHATNLITRHVLEEMQKRFMHKKYENMEGQIEIRCKIQEEFISKVNSNYKETRKIMDELESNVLVPKDKKAYRAFVDKVEGGRMLYHVLREKIRRMGGIIGKMQKEQLDAEIIGNFELAKLRRERSLYGYDSRRLQVEQSVEMKIYKSHITHLVSTANDVIRDLKKTDKYGELLLGLGKVCRKLQTEREKIMMDSDELEILMPDVMSSNPDDENCPMKNFLDRMFVAEADNVALTEERDALKRENQELRDLIKCYCEMNDKHYICKLDVNNLDKL